MPESAHNREADRPPAQMPGPRLATNSWPVDTPLFAVPSSQPLQLPVPPRLASWNRAGDPDQVRLARYLDAAEDLLHPRLKSLSGPLALRLDVGLPQAVQLLHQRDLDNYLFPLATRLCRAGAPFDCVWGTKQHSGSSLVRIEQAVPGIPPPFEYCQTVHTTVSSQSSAFKEQIREQLASASPIAPGPVRMQLCFTVGPSRNWLTLWKPAIDALGPILGYTLEAGSWSPLDGRIVDLGLHRRVDLSMANAVAITIAAASIRP